MIGFDEASGIIAGLSERMPSEPVPIDRAAGRVLAADVIAALDSPRFDVSSMDGYAVREADLARLPVQLPVVGASYPGQAELPAVAGGECVRIFTGAAVPAGLDRVVIQEIVRQDGDTAVFEQELGLLRHIRA